MAVVIHEMDSTVEVDAGAANRLGFAEAGVERPGAGGAPSGSATDLETFIRCYGDAVRAILRDEMERYLRSAAD